MFISSYIFLFEGPVLWHFLKLERLKKLTFFLCPIPDLLIWSNFPFAALLNLYLWKMLKWLENRYDVRDNRKCFAKNIHEICHHFQNLVTLGLLQQHGIHARLNMWPSSWPSFREIFEKHDAFLTNQCCKVIPAFWIISI